MAESRIKDENYYQVTGWMRNRLNLKGIFLDIYAIIYGFSQDGESEFTGSIQYLCDFTGASRPTVINALKNLTTESLLIKNSETINGVKFNRYKANLQVVKIFNGGSKEILLGDSKEILPNNKSSNNKNNIKNIYDENFEKLWVLLKSTPYDRKAKVSKKRKKELYEMGFDRVQKAINIYLKTQNPNYYHKRDNFFNEIIDNYIDKEASEFKQAAQKGQSHYSCFKGREEQLGNSLVTDIEKALEELNDDPAELNAECEALEAKMKEKYGKGGTV